MEPLQAPPEKREIYNRIVALTPEWQEARDRHERSDRMDGSAALDRRDCMAPINHQLEKIVELNLIGEDRGE